VKDVIVQHIQKTHKFGDDTADALEKMQSRTSLLRSPQESCLLIQMKVLESWNRKVMTLTMLLK